MLDIDVLLWYTKFMTRIERFLSKVRKTDSCWEWTGRLDRHGYGKFIDKKKTLIAHRFLYIELNGPLSRDVFCMHTCDNRKCVNPLHIITGSHQDNMNDMKNKKRQRFLSGSASPNSKLTESQVLEIRDLYTKLTPSYASIGKQYGVSGTMISDIINRKWWKHI